MVIAVSGSSSPTLTVRGGAAPPPYFDTQHVCELLLLWHSSVLLLSYNIKGRGRLRDEDSLTVDRAWDWRDHGQPGKLQRTDVFNTQRRLCLLSRIPVWSVCVWSGHKGCGRCPLLHEETHKLKTLMHHWAEILRNNKVGRAGLFWSGEKRGKGSCFLLPALSQPARQIQTELGI